MTLTLLPITQWLHDIGSIAQWLHDFGSIAQWLHDFGSIAQWLHDWLYCSMTAWLWLYCSMTAWHWLYCSLTAWHWLYCSMTTWLWLYYEWLPDIGSITQCTRWHCLYYSVDHIALIVLPNASHDIVSYSIHCMTHVTWVILPNASDDISCYSIHCRTLNVSQHLLCWLTDCRKHTVWCMRYNDKPKAAHNTRTRLQGHTAAAGGTGILGIDCIFCLRTMRENLSVVCPPRFQGQRQSRERGQC